MLSHFIRRGGRCLVPSTHTGLQRLCSHSVQQTEPPLEEQPDPLRHPDYFGVNPLVRKLDLLHNRVHMGHKEGTRNPHMLPYIFGNRLGVDIIDLDQTLPLMREALNVIAHVAYRKGVILFMTRHMQTLPVIEQLALECGEYSHCRTWHQGTFTDATMKYGAITRLPDLCVFMSTHDSVFALHGAIVEAAKMQIPTVAVVDSNCDPRLITYPIPGNDDTPCAVEYYCRLIYQAIKKGKNKRIEDGLEDSSSPESAA